MSIEQILNISEMPSEERALTVIEPEEYSDDVQFSKDNIKKLIGKATDSIDELMDIAKRSEHPRAYEVLANLLRTAVDANKELATIAIKEKGTSVVNDNRSVNNVFMTTSELLKIMKPHKIEEAIIDVESEEV